MGRRARAGTSGVAVAGLVAAVVAGASAGVGVRAGAAHGRARGVRLDERAFREVVRPTLQRAGCASPSCHGGQLLAMRLGPGGSDAARDLEEVRREVVPGDARASALVRKASGVDHLGGMGVEPGSCEASLLASWIDGRPVHACATAGREPTRAPGSSSRGIAAPVAPLPASLAPWIAGCAAAACHGAAARPALLDPARPGADAVDAAALEPWIDRRTPSRSRLFATLAGRAAHPRLLAVPPAPVADDGRGPAPPGVDVARRAPVPTPPPVAKERREPAAAIAAERREPGAADAAERREPGAADAAERREPGAADAADVDGGRYRALFAWIAGEPAIGAARPPLPSLARFAAEVEPILVRRGCTSAACHGAAGASELLLVGSAVDDYLRLLPRIADGTLPAKPRNLVAHGGGRRLGGSDDCATATLLGWLAGAPARRCTPRPPPDRARFARVVQPSLEVLTCPRCHADERLGFRLVAHPDAAALARNYDEVVKQVDLDFPLASPLLLRVREDCLQARVLAWVDAAPDPRCTVSLAHRHGAFPTPLPTPLPTPR